MNKPTRDLLEEVAIKVLVPKGYKGLVRKGLRVLRDLSQRVEALQPRTPQLPEHEEKRR